MQPHLMVAHLGRGPLGINTPILGPLFFLVAINYINEKLLYNINFYGDSDILRDLSKYFFNNACFVGEEEL